MARTTKLRGTDPVPPANKDVKPYANSVVLPPGTITVNTYADYEALIAKWAKGALDDTVIVIGAAGVGKSELALRAMGKDEHCYIKGQATKFGVYLKLFEHLHQPVILDDVDSLLASKEVTGLLKMLLETRSPRTIQWTTGQTMIGDSGIPARFATKSRTLVLANELKQVSKNFGAVLDRCTIVWFAPSPDEIHRYVGTWFKEKEIYDFVGERIHSTPAPSCRFYYHARKWKTAGLDWQKMITEMMFPAASKALLVRDLDLLHKTAKERVAAWTKATGESEQAYWATKRAVDAKHGKPQSSRAKAISAGMRRKHAARKAVTV